MDEIRKSIQERRAKQINQIQDQFGATNDDLQKAREMPIGTISNGRKKVAKGKWVRVKKETDPKKIAMSQVFKYLDKELTSEERSDTEYVEALISNHLDDQEIELPYKEIEQMTAKYISKQSSPKKSSKHIGDMSRGEKDSAAKKLGIDNPSQYSDSELNKKLTNSNVQKQLDEFKNRKK